MHKRLQKLIILCFWLLIWELFTRVVNNSFVLVGPLETVRHIAILMGRASFTGILYFSSTRILSAYFLAFLLALLLAFIAYRYPFFENLIQAPLFLLRSLPVASFVIILLFFLGRGSLSFCISFWMSFPVFYFSFLEGLKNLDRDKALSLFSVELLSLYIYSGNLSADSEQCKACNGAFMEERYRGGANRTGTAKYWLSINGCKSQLGNGRCLCLEHYHDCSFQVF